jgi:hypothetical protein
MSKAVKKGGKKWSGFRGLPQASAGRLLQAFEGFCRLLQALQAFAYMFQHLSAFISF